jgi:TRAP-type C4-dicarboxylate transport system substrate-binding protein
MEAVREAVDWQRQFSAEKDDEYWQLIEETGKIKIIEVDRELFKEATKPVYEEFAPIVGQENIDRINALKK